MTGWFGTVSGLRFSFIRRAGVGRAGVRRAGGCVTGGCLRFRLTGLTVRLGQVLVQVDGFYGDRQTGFTLGLFTVYGVG